MTGFFALLRLQLLSRYADLKPRNLKTQLREKKGRTIGMFIAIAILVLYLGGMLFFIETKMINLLIQLNMPEMLITMALVLATMGTIIMAFFFVLSSLYLGRDAAYLAALPLKPRTILSAKLTQVWLSETAIDAILLLPPCILYAVKTGAGIGFWLRLIPVWLLVAVLPICIIAFLSSLLIRLSALWKHREILLTVGGIALLSGYMFLMMNIGGLTGDAADGGEMMQAFVTNYGSRIAAMTKFFPPAGWAANGLLGSDYPMFILWIAISLAAPVLTVWLLGYSYRTLSMLQTETPGSGAKKRTGRESFANGSQLRACIRREFKSILRVPSYATNILPICFMPLLMVVMMSMIMKNTGADSGKTIQTILGGLPQVLVMCILAAVMAYMSGMNPALSTAVTREGKGHDFLKALPVPSMTFIRAKFIVGFGLGMGGLVAAAIALTIILPGQVLPIILALILCLLFCYCNSAMALCRDIRKPRLDWVTEQEAVKQNFGVLISMLISWGILIALGALCYFLIRLNLGMLAVFGIVAAILAVICVVTHFRLVKVTEKYYCQG